MLQIKTVVLQVLGKQQLPLVHILGKKSCLNYDKHAHLKKKNSLKIWNNVTVHADCATLIELEKFYRK